MKVLFKKLDKRAVIPTYAHPGDAGMDLHCLYGFELAPGERLLVQTGLGIALEEGFEAQVRPRSGNALKKGVTVLNAPGTIDSGYRGEVCALVINHGLEVASFEPGDRVAQLVVAPIVRAEVEVVEELPENIRGARGFGSTGN